MVRKMINSFKRWNLSLKIHENILLPTISHSCKLHFLKRSLTSHCYHWPSSIKFWFPIPTLMYAYWHYLTLISPYYKPHIIYETKRLKNYDLFKLIYHLILWPVRACAFKLTSQILEAPEEWKKKKKKRIVRLKFLDNDDG